MSFPHLFNSLDLANHGTPQNGQSGHQAEPIEIESTVATPVPQDPLANIEIDSPGSDGTAREPFRAEGSPPENLITQHRNNNNTNLGEPNQGQAAQPYQQQQGQPGQQNEQQAPNHRAEQAPPAHAGQANQDDQQNRAPGQHGGQQWNYGNHYPHQTQQQQAGYYYHPNYPAHLAAPVAQYPPAPVPAYNHQPQYPPHPSPAHRQHQPTPGASNNPNQPPPPPAQPSYQQTRELEEARLRQVIIDLKRNLDESKVANNNSNYRQILGAAKEAHRELEEFLGGCRHRSRVEEVAGYNPYHLNPRTMEPFDSPRPGPSSQRRKRAHDEDIEEMAENASNLLDMILVVKKMKKDDRDPDSKGKGKEREQ